MAALLKRSDVEWGEGVKEAAERKVQAQRDAQRNASSSSSSTRYPPSCPPSRGAASSHSQAPPPPSARPCLGRDIREDPNYRPSTSSSSSSSRPSTSNRPYESSSRSTPYQSTYSREYQSQSSTRSSRGSFQPQPRREHDPTRNQWRYQRQDPDSGEVWYRDRWGYWRKDGRN